MSKMFLCGVDKIEDIGMLLKRLERDDGAMSSRDPP